ncbi:TerC family protein [Humisphaera borealis]|uniref:TerC family protein n=1 Tax=Humisphaera borealis TaxID=2807512 RepID=A0A7M2X420_9BACT|nr:TerC family protein [Humisphaera borealis]
MLWIWVGFVAFVLVLLALDLGVFHRKAHVVSVKEALGWSAVWITLGLAFSGFVYVAYENHWMGLGTGSGGAIVDQMAVSASNPLGQLDGATATIKYLTGYVIEKSLSVDNIFVIVMIFSFLAVPQMYQHRVLFWGIIGALVMRGLMIGVGAALVKEFSWILYLFAAFLIITAIKMLFLKSGDPDPSKNVLVRLTRRIWPVTDKFHGQHFFVKAGSNASHETATPGSMVESDPSVERMEKERPGVWMATPLFLGLLMVEFTDLIFAVDSIPAIFAITTDPFLVFTSNVFAILGLRSLYFALAGLVDKFRYLKVALAFVLLVVGVKMLTHTWLKEMLGEHFNFYLLGVVLGILALGVIASIVANRRDARKEGDAGKSEGATLAKPAPLSNPTP